MAEGNLASIFAQIRNALNDQDYPDVIRCCNKALKVAPSDAVVHRTKVVALIRVDKYKEALNAIDHAKKVKLNAELGFHYERAYCLFRLDRLSEAEKMLASMKRSDRVTHLEAQIAYKRGQFDKAQLAYDQILNRAVPPEDKEELQINLIACKAARAMSSPADPAEDGQKLIASDDGLSYEQLFNLASAELAQGRLANAIQHFNEAKDVCMTYLKEQGWLDDEIEAELATIKAQLACAEYFSGDAEKARSLWEDAHRARNVDRTTATLAWCNVLATSTDTVSAKDVTNALKALGSRSM
ncbi:Srp72p, partial [Spiromyces aspiralis]